MAAILQNVWTIRQYETKGKQSICRNFKQIQRRQTHRKRYSKATWEITHRNWFDLFTKCTPFFYTKLIKAHNASQGSKYKTKAQDSAFGSNSSDLKNKTDNATDPKWSTKTKQLASFLNLAEGERTEIAIIVRTDDGMLWYANAAGNVIKFIQLHDKEKPSSIVWVQFDDPHVGQKTTHDNKTSYTQEIHTAWTPVKPVTTQFAVGRNRAAQVIRRQFPLGSRQDHT